MIDKTIAWDEYVKIPRINPSTLVAGMESMAELKYCIDNGGDEPTPAMRLGTAIHSLLLEPETFASRYVVMPDFKNDEANVTKAGKRSYSASTSYVESMEAQFRTANEHKTIIAQSEMETSIRCVQAVRSKPAMVELVDHSMKEVTVYGCIEGVEVKGRIDMLHPATIVDLKNTKSVSPRMFKRVFDDLGYAFRLSIYRELVRQNSAGVRDVKIIAQQVGRSFDNVIYKIPSEILDNAYSEVLLVIAKYKQALKTGVWHGVDEGLPELEIETPWWSKKRAIELDWGNTEIETQELQEAESPF